MPWTTDGAAALDAQSLASKIPAAPASWRAKPSCSSSSSTTAFRRRSRAGSARCAALGRRRLAFFEETEVFRCSAGNQALAQRLAAGLDLNQGRATNIRTGDRIFIDLEGGAKEGPYDYVVVAVPSVAMEKITIDGKPFPYRAIAHGPAVKYLSAIERRFWISEGVAPSGMSDTSA